MVLAKDLFILYFYVAHILALYCRYGVWVDAWCGIHKRGFAGQLLSHLSFDVSVPLDEISVIECLILLEISLIKVVYIASILNEFSRQAQIGILTRQSGTLELIAIRHKLVIGLILILKMMFHALCVPYEKVIYLILLNQ